MKHTIDVVKGDILVADDLPATLELLLKVLREQQYRVRVTTRGRLVLMAARLAPPDLILLDITMPEMNGYEVCQQLKMDQDLQHIPVIFISALDEVFDKVKAFEAGGVDYITKPFQFEEVLMRIETQLKITRLQKEMERKNIQLAKQNEDLKRKNEELVQLYKKAYLIFSALSEALSGWVLDEKYCLENKIGKGSHGVVYRAMQLDENRPVAIKIFQPNSGRVTAEILQRFYREGLSALRINHPNAISVFDFRVAENCLPYLVMELLEGHTLKDEIVEKAPLPPVRCAEIVIPVCNVLNEMHQAGIIHRDIKPENIFLHQHEGREVIKVLDFGIAQVLDEETSFDMQKLTITGKILGTPAYLAPERFNNLPCDGRTDIYSLGITLYLMLTGQLPFEFNGDLGSLVNMHLYAEPRPLRDYNLAIPVPLEKLVLRALSKQPDLRPTAAQFANELLSAIEGN
ncbi:MAG: response regulator [Acidobacteriota bacterium]